MEQLCLTMTVLNQVKAQRMAVLIQVEAGVSRYHEDRGRVTSSDFHVVIVIVHDSNSDTDSDISVVKYYFFFHLYTQ